MYVCMYVYISIHIHVYVQCISRLLPVSCTEHQLMIYDPSGVLLKQTAVEVNVDHLLVFGSAVAILGQAGSMIEEARSDGLPDRH